MSGSSRRVLVLLGVAVVPFLATALAHWNVLPGPDTGDYAQYLLHAKALAEGRPYSDIGYLYSELAPFLGPRAQPPGLPITLWPLLEFPGAQAAAVKLLMLIMSAAFPLLSGLYFARSGRPYIGAGVALLVALSPGMMHQSLVPLSDLPFCALVWWMILTMDGHGESGWGWGWRRILLVTAVGGLALLYRTVGIVLVPAVGAFALLSRRKLGWRPMLPAGIWVGAGLAVILTAPLAGGLLNTLNFDIGLIIRDIPENVSQYPLGVIESQLYPFPGNMANDLYHLIGVGAMALGLGVFLLRNRSKFVTIFAAFYAAMLVLSPVHQTRYLWPLYPLIVYGMLDGFAILIRKIRPIWSQQRAAQVALALAVLIATGTIAADGRREHPEPLARRADAREVFSKLSIMRQSRELRVVFFKPRVLTLETGIPAMALATAPNPDLIGEYCSRGITHVVVGDLDLSGTRELERTVRDRPQYFHSELKTGAFDLLGFDRSLCSDGNAH